MSKYAEVRAVMGSEEAYNDKSKSGRVLKWYSNKSGLSLAERKLQASQVLQKLIDAGVWYVQSVAVRNAKASSVTFDGKGYRCIEWDDDDKICVHIDKI
jgi:phosphoserine aminotransferase